MSLYTHCVLILIHSYTHVVMITLFAYYIRYL